jgi:hypothetical protein
VWEGSTPVVPVCADVGRRVRALTGAATGKRMPLPVEALPLESGGLVAPLLCCRYDMMRNYFTNF